MSTITVAVALAVLAADTPAPVENKATLFDEGERARAACYISDGGLSCYEDQLARLNYEMTATVTPVDGAVVHAKPLGDAERECLTGVEVNVSSPSGAVTVDWAESLFVVDRRAAAVTLDGDRDAWVMSTVPPGTTLVQKVFPAEQGGCLPEGEKEFRLAISTSGTVETARILVDGGWVSRTHEEAIAAIPPPEVPEGEPEFAWFWTSILGGSGAVFGASPFLLAAVFGAASYLGTQDRSGLSAAAGAFPAALFFGACCGGLGAGVGYFLLDPGRRARAAKHERALRWRAAWERERGRAMAH